MSKKWWAILIIVLLGSGMYYRYTHPKEDTKTYMEKEFVLNEVSFKITIAYENEFEKIFKAVPDEKYDCKIDYEIEINDDESFDRDFMIISTLNPISIDDIFLREFYQDDNIIIYGSDLKYYANGDPNDKILLFSVERYVYLKNEKTYFSFKDWSSELSTKMRSYDYGEYDEQKADEIREQCLLIMIEENKHLAQK